jgi:radical SAM protein with 4Fe4S-binding SPASM domain
MISERIDAITRIPADRLSARPPAPRSVKIELTDQCNFACQFCSLKDREHTHKRVMDIDLFKGITAEMRAEGVEEIGLFYIGESFMAPKLLVECIKYLKETLGMPYVFLTTNGSLAHPKTVQECMAAGLDSLKWSINAADDVQFAEVMGKPPKLFAQSLRNLKSAREIRDANGYKCGIYASSIQYDGDQAHQMAEMLERDVCPYVDQHYFLPLYGRMTKQSEERAAELGFMPTAGNQGRVGGLVDPLPCWAVFTEGHVRVDGHLSACCFGADDQYDMGDLTEQSFAEAWNGDKFAALREAHLKKDISGTVCDGCMAYN